MAVICLRFRTRSNCFAATTSHSRKRAIIGGVSSLLSRPLIKFEHLSDFGGKRFRAFGHGRRAWVSFSVAVTHVCRRWLTTYQVRGEPPLEERPVR